MGADLSLRIAAILLAVTGLGFGIPCVLGIRNLAAGRGVLMIFGYPSYGGGVFERFGLKSTVPLLAVFLVICALEVLAAIMLWNGLMSGAILALALLPAGLVFWIGFSLPFPPVLTAVSAVLTVLHWDRLA